MSPPALTYRGKVDTVENLARTLIVASAVHPAEGSFNLPLTAGAARSLGRALEWAIEVDRTHAERKADSTRRVELSRAMLAEANVLSANAKAQEAKAVQLLAEARATNVRSFIALGLATAFWGVGTLLWWLS